MNPSRAESSVAVVSRPSVPDTPGKLVPDVYGTSGRVFSGTSVPVFYGESVTEVNESSVPAGYGQSRPDAYET